MAEVQSVIPGYIQSKASSVAKVQSVIPGYIQSKASSVAKVQSVIPGYMQSLVPLTFAVHSSTQTKAEI